MDIKQSPRKRMQVRWVRAGERWHKEMSSWGVGQLRKDLGVASSFLPLPAVFKATP